MLNSAINEKLWDFLLSGGVFMAFIATCSFVAIAVSIHRALTLKWNSIIPVHLRGDLHRCGEIFESGNAAALLALMQRSESPVGRIGRVALSPEFETREAAAEATESSAKEQMVKLENGMGVLEVVITIAPLLGLLGTVSGLVSVFATLGSQENVTDPSQIAAGISVALNTTIAGLVVAVITVILHSYFTRRLERVASRLEVIAGHLVNEFYKRGGPSLYPIASEEEETPMEPDHDLSRAIEEKGKKIEEEDFLT
ncbi:MAG: MotA/TolQ/ExbB proton channel family protein [Verrucomicrobiota bacterium]